MLDYMRKNVQTFLVKGVLGVVICAFLGTIFLVWGMGGKEKGAKGNVAVTVEGRPVSVVQFARAYENKRRLYRNIYKERFSEMEKELNLRKQVLDEIIDRYLILDLAEKEGLAVTDEELKNSIKTIQVFQENGVFSPRKYKQVLSWNQIQPQRFEEEQRRDLLVKKMTDMIKDQAKVSKDEILEEYRRQNEKINVEYLHFTPALYLEEDSPPEEELKEYFNLHRVEYEQPEQRRVKYLLLDVRALEPETVSEEEVKTYYEANRDKFHQPQQVRASHILLKTPPGASQEKKDEIRRQAADLLKRVKNNEDFAKLAAEFSEDPGSAKKGGDLGYFGRGRMVPAFEEAAFSLKPGQVSKLVETPYGYHIIKVADVREAHTDPLEKVIPVIEGDLKEEKSRAVGMEMAEEVYDEMMQGKLSWRDVAARPEWSGESSGFFTRERAAEGILTAPVVRETAFQMAENEYSAPLQVNQGVAILRVEEIKEPYLPELDEVKERLVRDVKQNMAVEKARAAAEAAAALFKEGVPFDKLSGEVQVKESRDLTRQGYISEIGPVGKFAEELFARKEGELVEPVTIERGRDKSFALFLVSGKEKIDEESVKEEDTVTLAEQLLYMKKELHLQNWLSTLRAKAEIEIDERYAD